MKGLQRGILIDKRLLQYATDIAGVTILKKPGICRSLRKDASDTCNRKKWHVIFLTTFSWWVLHLSHCPFFFFFPVCILLRTGQEKTQFSPGGFFPFKQTGDAIPLHQCSVAENPPSEDYPCRSGWRPHSVLIKYHPSRRFFVLGLLDA